jgi:hypothetical protein
MWVSTKTIFCNENKYFLPKRGLRQGTNYDALKSMSVLHTVLSQHVFFHRLSGILCFIY